MTILEFLAQGSIDGKIMKSRFSRTFDEDFRETGESLLVTEKSSLSDKNSMKRIQRWNRILFINAKIV